MLVAVEINRCLLVVTLLLTTLAAGKRLDRKGASPLIPDPFEEHKSCLKSAESGCKATGWKATYNCSGSPPGETSISVIVRPSGSTYITFGDAFFTSSTPLVQALAGKFKLEQVAEQVCAPALKEELPNACDFFTPKNIAKLCGLEVMTWIGEHFQLAKGGLKDGVGKARNKASEEYSTAKLPLHPMGDGLGPLIQIGEGSGCTKKGWQGTYLSMGNTTVLSILIESSSTTITADLDVVDNLPDAFKTGLNFERPTKDVAKMVCEDPAVLEQFPDACPFFKPIHLGILCPKSALYHIGHNIKKGGKKLWGKAMEFFDKSDGSDPGADA